MMDSASGQSLTGLIYTLHCRQQAHGLLKVTGFDEIVQEDDHDFGEYGLKVTSVIHVGRLAVVSRDILFGAIGKIPSERLHRVKKHLSDWLSEE